MNKNKFGQDLGTPVVAWTPRERPTIQIMHGRYCTLTLLNIEKHAPELFAALQFQSDGESWTYLPYGPCDTLDEFKACMFSLEADKDTIFYTILDVQNKLPIGICAYLRINPEQGVIEVGHLHYSKILQKTPAATEAMYLMMRHVFDDLSYRRYEWKCNALNLPSRQAAERLGFQFEGIFRQAMISKGYNRDTAWFSIIDSEWPDLKRRFQKWLDPNNFAQNGQQRMKLQDIPIKSNNE